jgi:hypothetical protein
VFDLEKLDRWNTIRTSAIQSRSCPMRFLGFSNHEKEAPRQEISKRSTVFSTFSRSGWSVVRSASFAKGGTSKNRPSPHPHKVQTGSNTMSPRTFQMTLVLFIARPISVKGTPQLVNMRQQYSQLRSTQSHGKILILIVFRQKLSNSRDIVCLV